jgi:hypothetical protein
VGRKKLNFWDFFNDLLFLELKNVLKELRDVKKTESGMQKALLTKGFEPGSSQGM